MATRNQRILISATDSQVTSGILRRILATLRDDVITIDIEGHRPLTCTLITPECSPTSAWMITREFSDSSGPSGPDTLWSITLDEINAIHVW